MTLATEMESCPDCDSIDILIMETIDKESTKWISFNCRECGLNWADLAENA